MYKFSFIFIIAFNVIVFCQTKQSFIFQGEKSFLEIKLLSHAIYDGSPGITQIRIVSKKDSSEEKIFKLEGEWYCLGYNINSHKYVLVGSFQLGAWKPLREIKYFSESDKILIDSKVNSKHWFAFIAIPNDNIKYIIFIGQYLKHNFSLHVLNVDYDNMKVLGKPPKPPPVSENFITSELKNERWDWGSSNADGYIEMDQGIISFLNNDILKISYGNDDITRRNSKRMIKIFHLDKYFGN